MVKIVTNDERVRAVFQDNLGDCANSLVCHVCVDSSASTVLRRLHGEVGHWLTNEHAQHGTLLVLCSFDADMPETQRGGALAALEGYVRTVACQEGAAQGVRANLAILDDLERLDETMTLMTTLARDPGFISGVSFPLQPGCAPPLPSDAVVLITGGTSGLGKSLAAELHERGCTVYITGRRAELGERVAENIGCHFIRADVTRDEEMRAAFEQVMLNSGRLDVLVNNAGIAGGVGPACVSWGGKSVGEIEKSNMEEVVRVDYEALLRETERAAALMEKHGGVVINISSIYGLRVSNFVTAAYHAAKHAVMGFTCAAHFPNVQCFGVAPGIFPTEMTRGLFHNASLESRVGRWHPLGRAGVPGELATAVWALLCAKHVVPGGFVLPVDGAITCTCPPGPTRTREDFSIVPSLHQHGSALAACALMFVAGIASWVLSWRVAIDHEHTA